MDGDDEISVFPDQCPVSKSRIVFNCVTGGCPFLGYTPQRKYLYCGHPERDQYVSQERLDERTERLHCHARGIQERYAALLWRASQKWGLDSVYIESVPASETFEVTLGPQPNRIELFRLNGQWGFSMTIDGGDVGFGYSSFLKFCDPYPTRGDAIDGAIRYIEKRFTENRVTHSRSKAVLAWARSLRQASMQLKLF